ncbi:GIN domain-containing protein [Asticcacaulis sp. YBE204]|uniref:GIN domain-containing protein n=1 Tax=Asticcacaulis sp. YBE204 TaxID=1282363 RepID=UPI0003C3ED19|nr:DUF2807 domain-containing protein [Asticcacaulis sp. YBE204]ESQ80595.1 hypothetical protein AEYBE204_04815 [Asticcacaulis sp. YBE204]
MIRKLFIIAGAGFVLSLATLAGSAALVWHDLSTNDWSFRGDDDNLRLYKGKAPVQPSISRTLDWTAGATLDLDLPAEVIYTQGTTTSVTVEGPKVLADRVRLDKGRLYMLDGPDYEKVVSFRISNGDIRTDTHDDRLRVLVTAPSVKAFNLTGDARLKVDAYDQPAIDLTITGNGYARIKGQAKTLKLDISGYGEADLESLRVEDADVNISGSGETTIAPRKTAKVEVSGEGEVRIATHPEKLDTKISGEGTVEQE